jgi:CopG family transcriptional regulator, nickel-responsive regulator
MFILRRGYRFNGFARIASPPWEIKMQRVTITVDDDLTAELDRFMAARSYANRSEAIRDLARSGLQQAATEVASARQCVAALVYMYDHETRELPQRLARDFHERHDLAQTTLHVHLDHDNCLEITVLKGRGSDVQQFADHIIAERGVRHGHVVYLPADAAHTHGRGHGHTHNHGHRRRS